MITFKRGNLFESSAQCCVIPVNMEGVMGAGLALYAKKRFPGLRGKQRYSRKLKTSKRSFKL
jgi:hypothetical protein